MQHANSVNYELSLSAFVAFYEADKRYHLSRLVWHENVTASVDLINI